MSLPWALLPRTRWCPLRWDLSREENLLSEENISRQLVPQVCHLPSKVCSNCKIYFWEGFFYYACHNSDMLSRGKDQDKHDMCPKDKSLSNSPPATKRWQQSQILSRWCIGHASFRILNPDESVILTAITMLGQLKRRNPGLWGMNRWQTEEIWVWITCQVLYSEIKTKLISMSSLLQTTGSLQLNLLAENPLLPPGVTIPALTWIYREAALDFACNTTSFGKGAYRV